MNEVQYIQINNINIPIVIRSYKTSRHLKMYFKADILYISKPKYISHKKALEFVKENEEYVYDRYTKIISSDNKKLKKWDTGEAFYFKGEEYKINIILNDANKAKCVKIEIKIDPANKMIYISYPLGLEEIEDNKRKQYIDACMKKLLKKNTEKLLEDRVPYWSKITNIPYKEFKVNDATSKFGSCIPKTKRMHFSSRLIMLPENVIDGIIVHELCHIIYPNHSKDFYNLVKKYIPSYPKIHKWLKKNGGIIMF